jgi:predicted metal-dependent hydrolase
MKPRKAAVEFSASPAIWTPAWPGFAQHQNASALLFPYLEPFLIRVMKAARERLDPEKHAELLADIQIFNQQEANHYQTHARQNAVLREQYQGLEPFEDSIRREFDSFLRDRSLKANLAYCEGFESLGPIAAEFFFEHADEILEGADRPVTELWLWHLAEEFEHRRVCYDTYCALYGGHLSRVRGFLSFLRHFMRHSGRVRRYMQQQDERAGRVDRGAQARGRGRKLFWRQMRFVLPRLLGVLMPWYSPARVPDLRSVDRYLAGWEG